VPRGQLGNMVTTHPEIAGSSSCCHLRKGIVGGSVCVVLSLSLETHGYVVEIQEGARSPDSTSMSLSSTHI